MRIIILGGMGRIPFAGTVWQVLNYAEGFRRLGHDVYYVEDTGQWPYYASADATLEEACEWTANYIGDAMRWCSMPGHWAYRAAAQNGRIYGLSESQYERLFREADALINLTGSTVLQDEHSRVPVRVFLQTDPGVGEILAAEGDKGTLKMLEAHTHFANFGENLGAPDCLLPPGPFPYKPTRQPVILDWFAPSTHGHSNGRHCGAALRFTTVGNWKQTGCDIVWKGEKYTWSKHAQFLKVLDLPQRIDQPIELALASIAKRDIRLLQSNGWQIADACAISSDIFRYRSYLLESDGEFTVAKDQNIRWRTGWFSDRSACYLAAGKPVITQDTAFGNVLPVGEGLFAFKTIDDAVHAFEAIRSDYHRQSRAAMTIGEEFFRAEKVLAKLLSDLGI